MSDHQQLESIIRQRIEAAGGFIPFDQFMQAALYEPDLGYYEAKTVFGEKGDFVTAPELGPWLAFGFADLAYWCWQQLDQPDEWVLIEQGSGAGKLLASLLDLIAQLKMAKPLRVISVERSAQLRARQQTLFAERGHQVEMVASLDELEPMSNVVLYSNELPDAFPVRSFCYRGEDMLERGVTVADDQLNWCDGAPLSEMPAIASELIAQWPDGYISEWNPGINAWQQAVGRIIERGFVLTNDYGYSQQEYYRPGRMQGTLLAHIEQQTSEELLTDPGSRDITAHVDFTALHRAGVEAGFTSLLWMSQGGWLAQSPMVQSFLQTLATQNDAASLHLMAHAKRVLMPFGMGEVFKILLQSKGIACDAPEYLRQFDHLDQLT